MRVRLSLGRRFLPCAACSLAEHSGRSIWVCISQAGIVATQDDARRRGVTWTHATHTHSPYLFSHSHCSSAVRIVGLLSISPTICQGTVRGTGGFLRGLFFGCVLVGFSGGSCVFLCEKYNDPNRGTWCDAEAYGVCSCSLWFGGFCRSVSKPCKVESEYSYWRSFWKKI